MEESRENGDNTLKECVWSIMSWLHGKTVAIEISADFGDRNFFFSEIMEDGSCGICGGIIFHGFPNEGFQQNGSVMVVPSYGWHIHT